MASARSLGNYDLAAALADLIDNSLFAGARVVDLICLYEEGRPTIRVRDDGRGMSSDELFAAMRPASRNPRETRDAADLGRFGWGLKSASFSQCTCLTVLSARDGNYCGARWDLEHVDGWEMAVFSPEEVLAESSPEFANGDGTEVIWRNCDRLSEDGTLNQQEFNRLVLAARDRLALVFHRFLDGTIPGHRVAIRLNGTPIEPHDPFMVRNLATQRRQLEVLEISGQRIEIEPFILPHFVKLTEREQEMLGGEDGFIRNQGFYLYRANRLIIHGTWFGLAKFGEMSQLLRIRVDIPNALDALWKITLDKSDAQLPSALRTRLRQIVEGLRPHCVRVYRRRGGQIRESRISLWTRTVKGNEILYGLNRDHDAIAALYEADGDTRSQVVDAALRLIEHDFPVERFGEDVRSRPDAVHQVVSDLVEFKGILGALVPRFLADANFDVLAMRARLEKQEPFSSHMKVVDEFLVKSGWWDGRLQ
jgi:hypothetical protein